MMKLKVAAGCGKKTTLLALLSFFRAIKLNPKLCAGTQARADGRRKSTSLQA